MRFFVIAVALACVGIGVPAALALAWLAGEADDPAAVLARADACYQALGYLKYALALLVLVAADRAAVRGGYRGARRAALLWTPMLLFCTACVLQWGFVAEAYVRFARDYGLGGAVFSGAIFYLAAAFPVAFVVSLVNQGLVMARQGRSG